ncbi:MAG: hypothetical protein AAFZ65_08165, partial [Planctomycetota bacterium]
ARRAAGRGASQTGLALERVAAESEPLAWSFALGAGLFLAAALAARLRPVRVTGPQAVGAASPQ